MTTLVLPTRVCKTCGRELEITFFQTYGPKKRRRHSCKECRAVQTRVRKEYESPEHRERRLAQMREGNLRRNFGITSEELADMIEIREGLCDICGKPETRIIDGKLKPLCVDHSHTTGKVRGLLCSKCNVGLGMFGDNSDVLVKALHYLTKERG